MAITHTLTRRVAIGGGTPLESSIGYTGTGEVNVNGESVPDATTDQLIVIAIDVSAIQSIYIISTKALTLETNSATVPADTIVLVADVPYIWHTGSYFTNLLGTDVTQIFLTNASGAAATFDLRCVYDATP